MLLLRRGLSRLIKRLSFILRGNFLSSWAHTLKSTNEGVRLHNNKSSFIENSLGLTFLLVKGDKRMCLPDLTIKCLTFHHYKSHCRDHSAICTQSQK